MAVFDFPYHTFSTERPESSFRLKLGGSYQFSAPPSAPDQRIFKLKFRALKYFLTNGSIDSEVEPEINLARLEKFYDLHKLHATFTYPHPVYGDVIVSFNKPLNTPEGTIGGNGLVENIDIELIEKPGMAESAGPDLVQIEYGDLA
jgi:hypothetical protein